MTKDVLVTVCGKQLVDGQSEDIEVINVGTYHEKNGKKYIRYEEHMEDGSGVITNMIKISEDSVEMTKKGAVGAQMLFREKERINSCYDTPFGMLMMVVYTKKIECNVQENLVELTVAYDIEINGELMSDSNVYIKVEPRKTANVNLTE
ncbi:MAG: DUF1934 domain-containing protein [Lachnospiraceae bacterium]